MIIIKWDTEVLLFKTRNLIQNWNNKTSVSHLFMIIRFFCCRFTNHIHVALRLWKFYASALNDEREIKVFIFLLVTLIKIISLWSLVTPDCDKCTLIPICISNLNTITPTITKNLNSKVTVSSNLGHPVIHHLNCWFPGICHSNHCIHGIHHSIPCLHRTHHYNHWLHRIHHSNQLSP